MKTNKKAILGMLVAMVISLGLLSGISNVKEVPEPNLFLSCVAASNTELTVTEQMGAAFYGGLASTMYGIALGGIAGAAVGFGVGF